MISIQINGLEKLISNFKTAPDFMLKDIDKTFGRIEAMMETEAKRLTPVDTGLLRSSISGGMNHYSSISGLKLSFGTNLNYALRVHEGRGQHKVGERLFMEGGAKNSIPFLEREMIALVERVAKHITK